MVRIASVDVEGVRSATSLPAERCAEHRDERGTYRAIGARSRARVTRVRVPA
jgi:hypothetical protein